ncbi:sensor histidine kinase [Amnibacterium endophyticum]|uniref:histidine kinase n=1 Tax=Amnibacterium endophyticum TaxID=2109337 RepID=A0ABW4LJD3_9MICO
MPIPTDPAVLLVAGVVLVALVVLVLLWRRAVRRAKRLALRLAAAERRAAELAVADADHGGRLKIVRELHDVAVHRVSAMIAQADGARYAGATDPSAAVRAAQTIAETGRTTLADLRRVMTLVREGEADAAPQPALRSTRELFRLMREAGLQVEYEETGEPYALESGAELTVYRILQEAMSNALKHGGDGTRVRVGLTWTGSGLALRVEDDGFRAAVLRRGLPQETADAELAYGVEEDVRALTQQVAGPGIDDMRARAELYGGTLTVTETPGVGFGISAAFPTIRFHNGVHGVDLGAR